MRKLLLLIALVASTGMWAASWNKTIASVNNADEQAAPCALTLKSGSSLVAGTFNQDIDFGAFQITNPDAMTSAFYAIYDKEGNATCGGKIYGKAVITALCEGETGYAYAAGYASDVIQIATAEGTKDYGSESLSDYSFIVKLNTTTGVAEAVKLIASKADADIEATFAYFPETGDIYVHPSKLVYNNSKIYMAATHTGVVYQVGAAEGDKLADGTYLNLFDYMYMDLASTSLFETDGNLQSATTTLITVSATTDDGTKTTYLQHNPESFSFDYNGNELYVVFVGQGNETVKGMGEIGSRGSDSSKAIVEKAKFNFKSDDEGNMSHNFVVGYSATGADNLDWTVFANAAHDKSYLSDKVADVKAYADHALIVGTYYGDKVFGKEEAAVGSSDVFCAKFTAATKVAECTISHFDEGETTKYDERVAAVAFTEKGGMAYTYTSPKKAGVVESSRYYTFEGATLSAPTSDIFATSASYANDMLTTTAKSSDGMAVVADFTDGDSTGISAATATAAKSDKCFDLLGREVTGAKGQKIVIKNGQKFVVK